MLNSLIFSLISIYGFNSQTDWRKVYLEDPKAILPVHRSQIHDEDAEFAFLGYEYEKGTLWPKPQKEDRSDTMFFTFTPSLFKFKTSTKHPILMNAFSRYEELTFPDKKLYAENSLDKIEYLDVSIEDLDQPLSLNSNESYSLRIRTPVAKLEANSVWGALRGLETFAQAVYQNGSSYWVAENIITDYPRFKYRGFLIDTSRHYLPVSTIFQFLDAMTYSKFNVLHWHIVDDPSFPFVSKKFPQLHMKGAFNPKTHVYTQSDVKDIIEFARLRGIRVMPEFDTPGHTHSWAGIPNLLTDCQSTMQQAEMFFEDMKGPINPIREGTYEFLEEFFKEIADVFPDEYLHLGGDEVDFQCWMSNKNITRWLITHKPNSFQNGSTLHTYYLNRLVRIVQNLHKKYIVWQEVFDDGVRLDKDAIINVWKDGWESEMSRVTYANHTAVLSSCWYLNYINYGLDWPEFYRCDPHEFTGDDVQKDRVIGGSAAMWGEYVDADNIIQYSFGRAFAVAERLWSDKSVGNVRDALHRIWEQQCRYIFRGIAAQPVTRSSFCRREWGQKKSRG